MNRKKKVLPILASALIFSVAGVGQAQAVDIDVSVSPSNPYTDFSVVSTGQSYQVDVFSNGGDPVIQLYSGDAGVYNRYDVANPSNHVNEDDDAGAGLDSLISGTPPAGNYTLRVSSFAYWVNAESETRTYTLRYTGFNGYSRSGNALRLDTVGKTTEKSNVVSCTPGKYTFVNGGSTAETANIQSYVYTLLVNGKAVSILSTDNFKSVASHQFPTIPGNMAGTATLDGATWNLAGMSNYSAECQVNAFQSNANAQSVTTTAHDSVALAAAAEAAAKVQATKNMIADWAASNDELAKKYRDNRLAGKP
jgi:hypothetical protein